MEKIKSLGGMLAILIFGGTFGIFVGAALCGAQTLGDVVRMIGG